MATVLNPEELKGLGHPAYHTTDEESLTTYLQLWQTLQFAEYAIQGQVKTTEILHGIHVELLQIGPPTLVRFKAVTRPEAVQPKYRIGEELKLISNPIKVRGIVVSIEYQDAPCITLQLPVTTSIHYSTHANQWRYAHFTVEKVDDADTIQYCQQRLAKIPDHLKNDHFSPAWKHIFYTLMRQCTDYKDPPATVPQIQLATLGLPHFQPTAAQSKAGGMILLEQRPLVLIEGPPGTGKTNLIGALTYHLLLQQPQSQILLCTPSNKAADHLTCILQQIAKATPDNIYKPICIYSSACENLPPPHPDITLHDAALNPKTYSPVPAALQQYHQLVNQLLAFGRQPYRGQLSTAMNVATEMEQL